MKQLLHYSTQTKGHILILYCLRLLKARHSSQASPDPSSLWGKSGARFGLELSSADDVVHIYNSVPITTSSLTCNSLHIHEYPQRPHEIYLFHKVYIHKNRTKLLQLRLVPVLTSCNLLPLLQRKYSRRLHG